MAVQHAKGNIFAFIDDDAYPRRDWLEVAEKYLQNEGDIGVRPKKPYQISYDSLVPKKEDCENLLVPVCLSSSHIAFGSIRMEPVFMILGQSAATGAVLAINNKVAVQDVNYDLLKVQLLKDNQRLKL